MSYRNQNKTHYGVNVDVEHTAERACKRGSRVSLRRVTPPVTVTTYRVTCGACMRTKEYREARDAYRAALYAKELALADWRLELVRKAMGDETLGPVERVKEIGKAISSFPSPTSPPRPR